MLRRKQQLQLLQIKEQHARVTLRPRRGGDLQALLRRPNVKAALERIAANPSAMASETDPEVLEALGKLNGLLKG